MTETAVVVSKPPDAMVRGALAALARAEALVVAQPEDYAAAGATLVELGAQWNAVEALRKQVLAPIRQALEEQQAIFAGENGPLPILAKAKQLTSDRMGAWKREQDRIAAESRRLEEQRLAEQRRREEAKARELREKAEAEAREIRAKAEAEEAEKRREAEQLAAQGREAEAQRLRDQAALDSQRAQERAQTVTDRAEVKAEIREDRAMSVVAPVAMPVAPKVQGVATRKTWKYRIIDKAKIRPEYMLPDETTIQRLVTALKAAAPATVGAGSIEVYEDEAVVATGKRAR